MCVHTSVLYTVYIFYARLLSFPLSQIYKYEGDTAVELDGPLKGRLTWNGSQDLQDVSIQIHYVTYNDSGIYECHVLREFEFNFFTPSVLIINNITLKVKEKGAANCFPLSSMLFCSVPCCGLAKCLVSVSVPLSVQ